MNMNEELLTKINDALEKIQHPAINASLPQLGIIQNVRIEEGKIHLTLKLPFPNIPDSMRNLFVKNIQDALTPFGMNIKINLALMNQEEQQRFLQIENANWKGTPQGI
ncbi:MAG: iron-sulfur cluster assembly protein [Candidatus Lokiarchaeota archaeon]|nr:iron-sulfur cluster assembly protein [Candidatus Harpocratesius repetitus]